MPAKRRSHRLCEIPGLANLRRLKAGGGQEWPPHNAA